MATCTECGKPVSEGDRFCRACGATVPESAAAETPSAVPGAGPAAPTDPALWNKAKKRVKDRMELLKHIGMYVVVNAFLVVIWALSGHGYPWFLWVMAGWGLGLAIHIVTYFVGSRGDATREMMIEKEMERLRREQSKEPQ